MPLLTRHAVLNSVLQSMTSQLPLLASRVAQATTLSVPLLGMDVFSGSYGGSQDHNVAEMGLIGDKDPELVFCMGESIRGDNPQDTRPFTVL